MLIDQVTPSLLPIAADLVTAFDKATKRPITLLPSRRDDGIVILRDMQLQEMSAREVTLAVRAPICVRLLVVCLVLVVPMERQCFVRWQVTLHDRNRPVSGLQGSVFLRMARSFYAG